MTISLIYYVQSSHYLRIIIEMFIHDKQFHSIDSASKHKFCTWQANSFLDFYSLEVTTFTVYCRFIWYAAKFEGYMLVVIREWINK